MSNTRRPTLRGRVSLLATAVIAAWLVVLAVGFDVFLFNRIDRQIDDTLRVRAQAASALVEVRAGAVVGLRDSSHDSELDSSIWVYAGTRAIARPNQPETVQRAAAALAGSDRRYAGRGTRRFYVLSVRSGDQLVGSVIAAIDTAPYETTERLAVLATVVVTVLLSAGAYPVLRMATARALRPVETMTGQAADWSVSAPNQRFGTDQQHAELASLAGTLDQLLDRLAAVLRHERQVSAELSHELRTPLARIMAEAELSAGEDEARQRAGLRAIRGTAAAMDAIIDTLLAAARTELARTVGRTELDPLLERFATGVRATPRITAARTDVSVGVDDDVVTRILAPIVENATRFASGGVHLEACRAGPGVVVSVSNDGPRLPATLAERIFEPGFRADDSGHDGAGLGLALARRLARAADGDVDVDPTAAETTFRVTLPAG